MCGWSSSAFVIFPSPTFLSVRFASIFFLIYLRRREPVSFVKQIIRSIHCTPTQTFSTHINPKVCASHKRMSTSNNNNNVNGACSIGTAPGRQQIRYNTPIPEVKLILVGDGNVGKQEYIEALKKNNQFLTKNAYQYSSMMRDTTEKPRHADTLGVDIHSLLLYTNRGPIRYNIWISSCQEVT